MRASQSHQAFIDGLRAVAVTAVVVYHLNPAWLPGGFVGVDIFFAISGFVVTGSAAQMERTGFFDFLSRFYARRLARIVPALTVCLIATFLLSALFIPEAWLSRVNDKTGRSAFIGLSNFILAKNAGNYFAPTAAMNPFTHTWSLAVEEQFYLVFPLLFLAWIKGARRWAIAGFALATVASLACSVWLSRTDEVQAFYMPWSRFWQLGIGVVLAQALIAAGHSFAARSPDRRALSIAADLGLAAVVVGIVIAREPGAPIPSGLLPVLGTACVLGCLHGRRGGIADRLLTLRPVRYIGRISYSLYLWHWPVFVLMRWTTGLETPLQVIAASAATIGLAAASYHWVEQPARRLGGRLPRLAAIGASGAAVLLAFGLASGVNSARPLLTQNTAMRHKNDWFPWGVVAHTVQGCTAATQTVPFRNAHGGGEVQIYTRSGCAEPAAKRTLFVLGDSHAMVYIGMLKQVAAETGIAVHLYYIGGCPIFIREGVAGGDAFCLGYARAAMDDVLPRLQRGDVLFLPSMRVPRFNSQWELFDVEPQVDAFTSAAAERNRRVEERETAPILRDATRRGAWVVFEGPPPVMNTVPMLCSDWFNRGNPICRRGPDVPRALLERLRAPVLASYARLAQAVRGITVWDPFPLLCPGEQCSAYRDGKPLFFDGDHLSSYAAFSLVPSFVSFMQDLPASGP